MVQVKHVVYKNAYLMLNRGFVLWMGVSHTGQYFSFSTYLKRQVLQTWKKDFIIP